jgi:aminopeptidase N
MLRSHPARAVATALVLLAAPLAVLAQNRQATSRFDVEHYTIDAEIAPATSTLSATVTVRIAPVDDTVPYAVFELNNALGLSRVTGTEGNQVLASRSQADSSIRLNFDPPLRKGQTSTVTFTYDGKLTGQEESPIYGVRLAAIHPDFGYLLYPGRWFPVAGYTTDRFSADLRIKVPEGYTVVASGSESHTTSSGFTTWQYQFGKPSFPGSIAIVKGGPVKADAEGVTTSVYFRGAEASAAETCAQQTGSMMSFFTNEFGTGPDANLTVVETENGAPTGYAAPGVLFLAPRAAGPQTNLRVLANAVSRQWWEELVSPRTRNHIWLSNGMATYSEMLWTEHSVSSAAMSAQLKDTMVEALTIDNVPITQSARMEDYSPEYWALTGSKGATVMNMLRYVVGDDKYFAALKAFLAEYAWKPASTDDFQKAVEKAAGKDLGYFFLQWTEATGAPEFKLEYSVFRTQKGFRVMGKIAQDLDTFRMPVTLKIETEGNPEERQVEVVGTSSEFSVETFGKPKSVSIEASNQVLHLSNDMRVAVAIRRGEQFAELSQFSEAIQQYQKALETSRTSSLAHYRMGEVYFLQSNFQSAANEFREAINGDLEPKWTEVWSRINLGKIFDATSQRDRAVNEYNLALRTRDNTQGAQDEAARLIKTPYQRQKKAEE